MNISMSKIKGTRGRIDEASVLEEKIVMEKREENSQVKICKIKRLPGRWYSLFLVLIDFSID